MRVKTPEGHPPTFRFELCKRRRRAGMRDGSGSVTESIYVCHGQTGICWNQCADPQPPAEESGSSYRLKKKPAFSSPKSVEAPIIEFERLRELTRECEAELSAKYGISVSTLRRRWREYQYPKQGEMYALRNQ